MLSIIAKLLKVLNSENEPSQISLAIGFSMIAGLTPFYSLHNILILLLVLVLRVNLSAFILGLAFFSGVAYLLDPIFHWIGLHLLTAGLLKGLWEVLYNSTIWRLERFNNSIVMGSLLFSLLFVVPLCILMNLAILKYREHVLAWIQKSRLVHFIKASKFYETYKSLSKLKGES
ncbi:MAG: TIGR03546 family protein [Deltaproteobacteria bacterium]|nr:TIGR03546 family protein [Deltaproteobacteria bacterium]